MLELTDCRPVAGHVVKSATTSLCDCGNSVETAFVHALR